MIDKGVLDELRRMSKDIKTDEPFEQRDEASLQSAFGFHNMQYIKFIERLLSCMKVQIAERADMEKRLQRQRDEINALRGQVETLTTENQRKMEAYNGVLLQRAQVKAGTMKPAEKPKPTKGEIQGLLDQGFTQENIAEKYGCSRSTIWRILKG